MNIKKAVLINAMGKYSTIVIQLAVNIVLARLLSPGEYGISAVITTFSTFLYTLSAMGLGTAIVQIKNLDRDDIDSIFTFSVYVSLGLGVIFGFFSFAIAAMYGNQVYIKLGWMLSISLFFNGMNMVPEGVMSRDKRFVSMAVRTAVVYSAAGILAVILAYLHFSFYALIVQNIFSGVSSFVWNYMSTKPRFRLHFQILSIKKIFSYSAYQMGAQIVGYFGTNIDTLIGGMLLGEADVGYYNKAYTLSNYPVNNFAAVISGVLHAVLSDYQDDKNKLYEYHIRINRILGLAGVYIGTVCYLAADELMTILFGTNWSFSIICFRILSITMIFRMMNSATNAIYQSLGRTDLLFRERCIKVAIMIGFVLFGIFKLGGLKGFVSGVTMAYACFYALTVAMLCIWGFESSIFQHIWEMRKEIAVQAFMIAALLIYPFSYDDLWLSFIVKAVYLLLFYSTACLIFERNFLKGLIKNDG